MSAPRRGAAESSRDLAIGVDWRLRKDWRAVPLLCRVARHVAAAEGFGRGQLSIVVVGRRAMATLHARHLQMAGPTDVLTFDLGTDRGAHRIDGEVFVCADVAKARAARRTLAAARAELALYLTHGILHLAGYDDHEPAGFRRMHRREDELLAQLGLGRVFGDGE